MRVHKNGVLIRISCMVYIMPKTTRGSIQFASCSLEPGFQRVCSIDMNTSQFCLDGKWFHMEDFEFSNPEYTE